MSKDEFLSWLETQANRNDTVGQLAKELESEPAVSHILNYEQLRDHIFGLTPYLQPALNMLIDAKCEFDELTNPDQSKLDVL